jgi:acetolactate synthase-1/2/3 large subunit
VDTIFGFPGGAVIDIYDELVKTDIRHILVRHEQGAVHAADGYARASGRPGVCLVTSGPGATNTVTGIATAYMDSIPMVVITGQVPTHLIGNDAFQEVDITGITRPCTKHNYLVKSVDDLARVLREAFYIAMSGRPGPVLVDIPKDVANARTRWSDNTQIRIKSYQPNYKPNMKQLKKVVGLIKKAKRPAALRRRRLDFIQCRRSLYRVCPADPHTGDHLAHGVGGLPRVRSALARHDRHARHLSGQYVRRQL